MDGVSCRERVLCCREDAAEAVDAVEGALGGGEDTAGATAEADAGDVTPKYLSTMDMELRVVDGALADGCGDAIRLAEDLEVSRPRPIT